MQLHTPLVIYLCVHIFTFLRLDCWTVPVTFGITQWGMQGLRYNGRSLSFSLSLLISVDQERDGVGAATRILHLHCILIVCVRECNLRCSRSLWLSNAFCMSIHRRRNRGGSCPPHLPTRRVKQYKMPPPLPHTHFWHTVWNAMLRFARLL